MFKKCVKTPTYTKRTQKDLMKTEAWESQATATKQKMDDIAFGAPLFGFHFRTTMKDHEGKTASQKFTGYTIVFMVAALGKTISLLEKQLESGMKQLAMDGNQKDGKEKSEPVVPKKLERLKHILTLTANANANSKRKKLVLPRWCKNPSYNRDAKDPNVPRLLFATEDMDDTMYDIIEEGDFIQVSSRPDVKEAFKACLTPEKIKLQECWVELGKDAKPYMHCGKVSIDGFDYDIPEELWTEHEKQIWKIWAEATPTLAYRDTDTNRFKNTTILKEYILTQITDCPPHPDDGYGSALRDCMVAFAVQSRKQPIKSALIDERDGPVGFYVPSSRVFTNRYKNLPPDVDQNKTSKDSRFTPGLDGIVQQTELSLGSIAMCDTMNLSWETYVEVASGDAKIKVLESRRNTFSVNVQLFEENQKGSLDKFMCLASVGEWDAPIKPKDPKKKITLPTDSWGDVQSVYPIVNRLRWRNTMALTSPDIFGILTPRTDKTAPFPNTKKSGDVYENIECNSFSTVIVGNWLGDLQYKGLVVSKQFLPCIQNMVNNMNIKDSLPKDEQGQIDRLKLFTVDIGVNPHTKIIRNFDQNTTGKSVDLSPKNILNRFTTLPVCINEYTGDALADLIRGQHVAIHCKLERTVNALEAKLNSEVGSHVFGDKSNPYSLARIFIQNMNHLRGDETVSNKQATLSNEILIMIIYLHFMDIEVPHVNDGDAWNWLIESNKKGVIERINSHITELASELSRLEQLKQSIEQDAQPSTQNTVIKIPPYTFNPKGALKLWAWNAWLIPSRRPLTNYGFEDVGVDPECIRLQEMLEGSDVSERTEEPGPGEDEEYTFRDETIDLEGGEEDKKRPRDDEQQEGAKKMKTPVEEMVTE